MKHAISLKNRRFRILLWFFFCIMLIPALGEYLLSLGFPFKHASLEPYLLRNKNDDWTHNAFTIQQLRERVNSSIPLFIFIGSSAAREAISKDAVLEEIFKDKIEKEIELVSVCTSSMSLSDQAKVIKAIPVNDITYLIALDPLLFTYETEVQLEQPMRNGQIQIKYFYLTPPLSTVQTLSRHGFSPALKHRFRLSRTIPVTGEVLKKQLLHFYAAPGRLRSISYDRHIYKNRPPVAEKETYVELLTREYLDRYRKNWALNRDLLSDLVDIALSNGNSIILVDLPCNPLFSREMNEYYSHYDRMIEDIVITKSIGYINLRHAAEWSPVDFVDVHHMRTSGQEKFTEALAIRLADYMK